MQKINCLSLPKFHEKCQEVWEERENIVLYNDAVQTYGIRSDDRFDREILVKKQVKPLLNNLYALVRMVAKKNPLLPLPSSVETAILADLSLSFNALWNQDLITKLQEFLILQGLLNSGDIETGRLDAATVNSLAQYLAKCGFDYVDKDAKTMDFLTAKILQQHLSDLGFYKGDLDGDFSEGSIATAALSTFIDGSMLPGWDTSCVADLRHFLRMKLDTFPQSDSPKSETLTSCDIEALQHFLKRRYRELLFVPVSCSSKREVSLLVTLHHFFHSIVVNLQLARMAVLDSRQARHCKSSLLPKEITQDLLMESLAKVLLRTSGFAST